MCYILWKIILYKKSLCFLHSCQNYLSINIISGRDSFVNKKAADIKPAALRKY